jgi:hypothetical protein
MKTRAKERVSIEHGGLGKSTRRKLQTMAKALRASSSLTTSLR